MLLLSHHLLGEFDHVLFCLIGKQICEGTFGSSSVDSELGIITDLENWGQLMSWVDYNRLCSVSIGYKNLVWWFERKMSSRDWNDGSVVKSTGYSSTEPRFNY